MYAKAFRLNPINIYDCGQTEVCAKAFELNPIKICDCGQNWNGENRNSSWNTCL